MILPSQYFASQIIVAQTLVQHQSRLLEHQPVGKDIQTGVAGFRNIAVGGVEQVVCIDERILLYLVVAEFIAQSCTQNESWIVIIKYHVHLMRLHYVEVCITIANGGRITAVNIRVKVGNSRTGDAHAVVHTEIHAWSDGVRDAGARYEIAVIFIKIITLTLFKLHFLPGLFVSGSQHGSYLSEVSLPFCIGGKNVLGVLILHTVGRVQRLSFICRHIVVA